MKIVLEQEQRYSFLKMEKRVNEYTIIIYGDVDGSGIINARDLLMLTKIYFEKN